LVEELSGRTGEGCVLESRGDHLAGTVFGERFEARYEGEVLTELEIGAAHFTRVPRAPRLAAPPDLFGAGFAIQGVEGNLALLPAVPAVEVALPAWELEPAKALAERVHDSFTDAAPTRADWQLTDADEAGGCLAHARRFQAWAQRSGHTTALVFGLLEDEGRAYPHAWVRVGLSGGRTADLDPTTLEEVGPGSHLPLAATAGEPGPQLGARYLELASGSRRVVRRP
jgi:hypothetical protein